MPAPGLERRTVRELLGLHVSIMEELRRRGVVRSANNPTGDLAEHLFCRAFGWTQAPNSSKGFDATDGDGTRYQIKGRRLHPKNPSRQLSAIRDLDGFDQLAAVLFDEHYGVLRAALLPVGLVRRHTTFVGHTNSQKFLLRDEVLAAPDAVDVTDAIRKALEAC